MLTALAFLCFASAEGQLNLRSNASEWSGTWVLQKSDRGKKNSQVTGKVTLVISQTGKQINITRKLNENGNETVQELTYYTDGRGDANPSRDGTRTLRSTTQLRNNRLIIKFSPLSNTVDRRAVVNERTDEWKLSSDGRTLTQTSSFSSSSSDSDASNNPFGSPRAPNILASPLRWKVKQVFKRI